MSVRGVFWGVGGHSSATEKLRSMHARGPGPEEIRHELHVRKAHPTATKNQLCFSHLSLLFLGFCFGSFYLFICLPISVYIYFSVNMCFFMHFFRAMSWMSVEVYQFPFLFPHFVLLLIMSVFVCEFPSECMYSFLCISFVLDVLLSFIRSCVPFS